MVYEKANIELKVKIHFNDKVHSLPMSQVGPGNQILGDLRQRIEPNTQSL